MDNLKIESVNINDIKPYKNNAKEYKKKYYQEHKDEISRKSKEYRLKNKEKIKQRQHEWYMRNKEQVIERVTEYNKNNNDKRKQWTKNYKIKNIDKINQYKNNNKENLKNYHNKYMKDKMQNDSVFKLKAFLKAQETGKPVELCCAIGDTEIDGKPYSEIVEEARQYINEIGGFEKFAEWGLY